MEYLNQSVRIAREKGFDRLVVFGLRKVVPIKKGQGNQDEALKDVEEMVRVAKSIDFMELEGKGYVMKASILMEKGRLRESAQYLDKAIPIAEDMQDNLLIMGILHNRARIFEMQGNPLKAKEHFCRSLKISQRPK